MPNKLTDEEIIRIMEICVNKTDVFVIHHNAETKEYDQITIKDILGVINRLQEEKQNIEIELQAMRNAANGFKAANERLKKGWEADVILTANIKSEAYKEFAERLKEKYKPYVILGSRVAKIEIDNLLKELVGDNNGKEKE